MRSGSRECRSGGGIGSDRLGPVFGRPWSIVGIDRVFGRWIRTGWTICKVEGHVEWRDQCFLAKAVFQLRFLIGYNCNYRKPTDFLFMNVTCFWNVFIVSIVFYRIRVAITLYWRNGYNAIKLAYNSKKAAKTKLAEKWHIIDWSLLFYFRNNEKDLYFITVFFSIFFVFFNKSRRIYLIFFTYNLFKQPCYYGLARNHNRFRHDRIRFVTTKKMRLAVF